MKISYNWLREFIEIDLAPRDLAAKLTMVGLAVDGIEPQGEDFVLEIDLTSNRPDCLSHLGVAREVAAITGNTMALPGSVGATGRLARIAAHASDVASVEILSTEFCPRYTARVIKGVKIGPSPQWLVSRLEAMGQRSVNNVADITNYVMLELGQPLHAFDLNMLRGQRIIVRAATPGEKMTTLDGEERTLTPHMLVIADAERPVAIGGIKGGEDSGITDATTDVLLEAAYFTPAQIRATSKALGLATEASYRFERGTDPEIVPVASTRAAQMIAEIAGGEILEGIVDVYPQKPVPRTAVFRREKYQALTGLDISLSEAQRILQALGMETAVNSSSQSIKVTAPTWRIDVAIEEDLIEEVARISGYDKLRTTLPGGAGAGTYLPGETARRAVRQTLTESAFLEAVSFSFVNAESDAIFSQLESADTVVLSNPIDETQSQMRTTLLGGLLAAVEHNFNHGLRHVRLFEMGKCFAYVAGEPRPQETEKLALVMTGARNENAWQGMSERVDFYDLKGVIESIAARLEIRFLHFAANSGISYLHPGRTALISLRVASGGRQTIGHLGQLHPQVAARYKFRQPVFIAELDFGFLLQAEKAGIRYRPLPKFPTVTRDLAILLDEQVEYSAIENEILALPIQELMSVRLFDLFTGNALPAGKRSLALTLRYRAEDRTLTEAEINTAHEQVVSLVRERFAAEIR